MQVIKRDMYPREVAPMPSVQGVPP